MDEKEILEELFTLCEEKGPGNYYPADSLKCYRRGDESFAVALNKMFAEGLIVGKELDPDSRRAAVALNPERLPEVKRMILDNSNSESEDGVFAKGLLLILVLGFGLLGLHILGDAFSQTLWFLFCLVCYPVVLAFTHGSATLKGARLIELYRVGVEQIPFVGELLTKIVPSGPNLGSEG